MRCCNIAFILTDMTLRFASLAFVCVPVSECCDFWSFFHSGHFFGASCVIDTVYTGLPRGVAKGVRGVLGSPGFQALKKERWVPPFKVFDLLPWRGT